MPIIKKKQDKTICIQINGPLSVYEVGAFKDEFIACLDAYEVLQLDLNSVSECDTAGVQLLYSTRMTAQSLGKTYQILNCSEAVENAVTLVGLSLQELILS